MARVKEEMMRFTVMNALEKKDRLSIDESIELLHVSESTVRRLFAKMEATQDVIRVHGGIRRNPAQGSYQYFSSLGTNQEAKRKIGIAAANQVENDDFIFIDCGTTTVHMAQRLVDRLRDGELHGVTVVTNSLANLELLAPSDNVMLSGGSYYQDRRSFAGYFSEKFLDRFHFNKSFIGVDGFTFEEGFATADPEFARLSAAAMKISEHAFVLMDSSKIGKRAFMVYDKYERVHRIITDSRVTPESVAQFRDYGIEVLIAE